MVSKRLLVAVTKPTTLVGLVVLCLLFDSSGLHAQWKRLIHGYDDGMDSFGCIYFLDSSSRTGFATVDDSIYRTTDGGYTWKASFAGLLWAPNSFAFKNSMVGWGSLFIKTVDGGNTWFNTGISSLPDGALDSYYDKKYHTLLMAGGAHGVWISYDDGTTWTCTLPLIGTHITQAFSFWNDDTGVVQTGYGFYLTIDGGNTWQPVADISDELSQVLAIPGTTTGFAIDIFGVVRRTDDLWRTWQDVYQFAPEVTPDFSFGKPGPPSNTCITGDLNNLYVTLDSGCFRSTDQGKTWKYLCGVGPTDGDFYTRFYAKDNRVFMASLTYKSGTDIWMLNVDSMQYFPTGIQFPSGAKDTTIVPGTPVTVNFIPETTDPIALDSGTVTFQFDTNDLDLRQIKLPPDWNLVGSEESNGILRIHFLASDSLPNPIVQLSFSTYLSPSSSSAITIYLDSASLFGHRLNCDCQALSILRPDSLTASAADSVQIHFLYGCGDSLLLAAMQHEPPFRIERIVPNPAQTSIAITLVKSPDLPIAYSLYDALGRRILSNELSARSLVLDVSKVPSGIYYLRLSSNGYAQSRSLTIER